MHSNPNLTRNLSLDLETGGITPGCGIWQIGCVVLEDPRIQFKATINPKVMFGAPWTVDGNTLKWQQDKNKSNWEAAFDNYDYITISSALRAFADWYKALEVNFNLYLWTKGPHFDIAILDEAYRRTGSPIPWKYNSIRDMRTLQHLFPNVEVPKPDGTHDALVDALWQADIIRACFQAMIDKGMMK